MSIWQAIILAIVEGITEFLPVSSTGHMIIASSFMGISHLEFTKMFTVNIQFGAILSVVVLYWKRFFQSVDFYIKLIIAVIPALVLGFLLNDFIDSLLENVIVVAITLLIGGIILIFIDRLVKDTVSERELSYFDALKIGLFQCIAMIPGVSRSASSIIGGMLQDFPVSRQLNFLSFLQFRQWQQLVDINCLKLTIRSRLRTLKCCCSEI